MGVLSGVAFWRPGIAQSLQGGATVFSVDSLGNVLGTIAANATFLLTDNNANQLLLAQAGSVSFPTVPIGVLGKASPTVGILVSGTLTGQGPLGSPSGITVSPTLLAGTIAKTLTNGVFAGTLSANGQTNAQGIGISLGPTFSLAGGTFNSLYGLSITPVWVASPTNYGTYIGPVSGGTSNNYGLYIDAVTGTGAFGLYVVSATNLQGGQLIKRTTVNDQNYNVLATDYLVVYTALSVGRTVQLPTPSAANAGQKWLVKDESGNAGADNITVQVIGGANIDGAATAVINTNYGDKGFYSNGTQMFSF